MAKYERYEEYKNFESVFLNEIPVGWKVKPLSALCEFRQGKAHEPFIDDDGEFICVSARFVSTQGKSFKRSKVNITPAKLNDILMVMSDLPNGRALARAFFIDDKKKYAVNQRVCAITAKKVHAKFLYYQLNRSPYFLMFDDGSNQTNLSNDAFNKYPVLLPPEFEQTQIANFLDHETAQIDTLIEKQQALIQLLKEKRQAVISHAVTKGLNPDAPMKDSGVEWLGEVPEHWDLSPLKYLCNFSGGGTPTKDNLSYWTGGTIPWVSPKDMKSFWIDKTQDYITENAVKESSTKLIKAGSLLMVVRSGILQRTIPIAINTVDVTMNQDMRALQFNERMTSEYAANYIVGNVDKLLFAWSKEGATVESIEQEYLSNSLFPVPPIAEQQRIVDKINEQMKTFDSLVSKAQKAIQLMQERRTALISAAVTGKIDVRGWVAPQ